MEASSDKEWDQTLFGCLHDPGLCILVYFAPCYIEGKVSEKLHDSFCQGCLCSLLPVIQILYGAVERQTIRERQHIDGTLIEDMLLWFFCPFCALAQQAWEIRAWSSQGPDERDVLIQRQ